MVSKYVYCQVTGLTSELLNLVWPSCFGGCELCRDTGMSLRAAGAWKDIDLAMPIDAPWWSTTPHSYGIMTKP